jgi:hypothetical protein
LKTNDPGRQTKRNFHQHQPPPLPASNAQTRPKANFPHTITEGISIGLQHCIALQRTDTQTQRGDGSPYNTAK